jgi:PmbA protein
LRLLQALVLVCRAIQRAESSLDGSRMSLEGVPVVFDTYEFAMIFLSAISQFDGESVGRGKSYLSGKKEQRIADYGFYLIDGPEHPTLPFKVPFDHEGIAVQRKELLSSGVVRSFMYDLKSAAEFGAVSTGNGFRGSWGSLPSVRPAITYIEIKGKKPISSLDKYFLVTSVKGVHSGFSPISGTLSVGVDGVLVEGENTTPVQGVTLSGNFWEMLGRIAAADDDVEFLTMGSGLFGAPKVAFEGLKITG